MMGRSHALSAAVAWLGLCAGMDAAAPSLGIGAPRELAVIAGAATAAGCALLPDIDHPGSTVARTLGPVTRTLAWLTAKAAGILRRASCTHCAERVDRGGHRAVTHTAVFAAALGLGVAAATQAYGAVVALTAVGISVWLLAHVASAGARVRILHRRIRPRGRAGRRLVAAAIPVAIAAVAAAWAGRLAGDDSMWWVGVAVGVGILAHSLGDALTRSGAPLCWPLSIAGCRWRAVGTPRLVRFTTGGTGEKVTVALLWLAGAGATYVLIT